MNIQQENILQQKHTLNVEKNTLLRYLKNKT